MNDLENFSKDTYPVNLTVSLSKLEEVEEEIQKRLKEKKFLPLNKLYDTINEKIYRNIEAFDKLGYAANEQSKNSNSLNEFKGLYIFCDGDKPVYIGISRSVFRRLRQHGWGSKHNQCSLAYLIAKYKNGDIERSTVHKIHEVELETQKKVIRNYNVLLYPVSCNYELYFLEVALAIKLKTYWNSFKTH